MKVSFRTMNYSIRSIGPGLYSLYDNPVTTYLDEGTGWECCYFYNGKNGESDFSTYLLEKVVPLNKKS